MKEYMYPKNLKATANLWLWGLKDFIILAVLTLFAVFYPRITITVCNLWMMFVVKGTPAVDSDDTAEVPAEDDADDAEPTEDEDDEEKPDEFERFVSGFYKGDKNTKNNS